MNSLFKKIKQWIITYQADIILFIGVILISLLSFALGFILAKQQEKEPIRIEFKSHELGYELYANYMRIYDSYIRSDS